MCQGGGSGAAAAHMSVPRTSELPWVAGHERGTSSLSGDGQLIQQIVFYGSTEVFYNVPTMCPIRADFTIASLACERLQE